MLVEGLKLELKVVVSVEEGIIAVSNVLKVFSEMLNLEVSILVSLLEFSEKVRGVLALYDFLILLSEQFLLLLNGIVVRPLSLVNVSVERVDALSNA